MQSSYLKSAKFSEILIKFLSIWYIVGICRPFNGKLVSGWTKQSTFFQFPPYVSERQSYGLVKLMMAAKKSGCLRDWWELSALNFTAEPDFVRSAIKVSAFQIRNINYSPLSRVPQISIKPYSREYQLPPACLPNTPLKRPLIFKF